MDQQQLRHTLQKLDAELASADPADAPTRAFLEDLRGDVQGALAQQAPAPTDHHRSIADQLRDAIPRFESTHPTLTVAMAEVVDILNRIGI